MTQPEIGMNISFREPATLAERIKDARADGNHQAAAVSIDGAEPVYGEMAITNEPRLDTAFGRHIDFPGRAEWSVVVEGYIQPTHERIPVRMGTDPAHLNYSGDTIWKQADVDYPGAPTTTTLVGTGELTRHD